MFYERFGDITHALNLTHAAFCFTDSSDAKKQLFLQYDIDETKY